MLLSESESDRDGRFGVGRIPSDVKVWVGQAHRTALAGAAPVCSPFGCGGEILREIFMDRGPCTDSAFPTRELCRRREHLRRLLLPLALLVGGCGGDGGGGSQFVTGPGEGAAGDSSGVNGELSGRVVFTLVTASTVDYPPNTVLELDLRTGSYTALSGNASVEANGLNRSDVTLWLEPDRSSDRARLIGTANRCAQDLDETTCVLFMDENARIESLFIVRDDSAGVAKRSRDGRFIAMMNSDSAGLELYDAAGQRLSVNPEVRYYGSGTGSPYDWTPDGRILLEYQEGPTPSGSAVLALTLPYSTEIDTFITLPEAYEGDVETIEVSPSGDRAAILLDGEDRTNGTYEYRRPAVIDLQSLAVYEPLAVEPGESMDARHLVWSPDGRWLLFRRDWDTAPLDAIGALPISPLYAVRVDGGRHALPVEPSGSTDKVRMLVMRPIEGGDGSLDPANQIPGPSVWRE